jgi:hypothetical protein
MTDGVAHSRAVGLGECRARLSAGQHPVNAGERMNCAAQAFADKKLEDVVKVLITF